MLDSATKFLEPEDAPQRMASLVGIPSLLADFDVRLADVIADLPLDPASFSDPEIRIPFGIGCNLLQRCVDATGCAHFGLLLGARSDDSVLGFAGEWMRNAPTLGGALAGFVGMQPSASRGATVYMHRSNGEVVLGYGIYGRRAVGWQHAYPLVAAMAFNVTRRLTARKARPLEVLLSMREPSDKRPYVKLFNVPVRFDQAQTALVFSQSTMDLAISGRSSANFAELERRAAMLMPPTRSAWTDHTRRTLRALLVQGETSNAAVAHALGLTVRSLARHLKAEGTHFQEVLDELRYTIARELLEVTDLSGGEISHALHYAGHSAFSVAFRRWSGMSPQAWRSSAPNSVGLQRIGR